MDYPDLIESLFLHSLFSPSGKLGYKRIWYGYWYFAERNKTKRNDKEIFYGIKRIKMNRFSYAGNKDDLFRKMTGKFRNHFCFNNQQLLIQGTSSV